MKKIIILFILVVNSYANNYGALLFSGNCVTCHFYKEKKSAPSIAEIKEHYLRAFPKQEDFVAYMVTWILNPDETSSIMLHSIEEFGLMPELAYDEDTLKEIAKYIYETDFTKIQD